MPAYDDYKDKALVQRKYDALSACYDELYGGEQKLKYDRSVPEVLSRCPANVNVLDVGCGTGLLIEYLSGYVERLLHGIYYVGIDVSYDSLTIAQEKARGVRLCCDLIQCDAEDVPIKLSYFDVLFSYTVVHHFRSPIVFIDASLEGVKRYIIISILKQEQPLVEELESYLRGGPYRYSVIDGGKDWIFIVAKGGV